MAARGGQKWAGQPQTLLPNKPLEDTGSAGGHQAGRIIGGRCTYKLNNDFWWKGTFLPQTLVQRINFEPSDLFGSK